MSSRSAALDDECKTKSMAESSSSADEYENDAFEEEAVGASSASAAVAGDEAETEAAYEPTFDAEDSGEEGEPFEEEEVESAPLEQFEPMPVLTMRPAPASQTRASSAAVAPASKPASSLSSLPRLGGLPSINDMGSSLTAAGRAHFAATSLFGRGSSAASQVQPKAASKSASSAAASPASSSSSLSAAQRAAYASSNLIWSAEPLGILSIPVSSNSSEADAPTSWISVDGGRLKLWAGHAGAGLASEASSLNGGADNAAAQIASGGVYLRAALCSDEASPPPAADDRSDANFLHLFVEADSDSPPLSSLAFDSAATSASRSRPAVGPDGTPSAELPPSLHPKSLGCFRLRVLGRSASLPPTPESFPNFMARAAASVMQSDQQQQQQQAPGGAPTVNGAPAAALPPFSIQPLLSLLVGVEKLVPPQGVSNGATQPSSTPLPLLPLNCPTRFWLSSHQSSSRATLLFSAPPSSDSSSLEQLEVSLDIAPLHTRILSELALTDPEPEQRDFDESAAEAKSSGAAPSRKEKKAQKSKLKKKQKKAQANAASDKETAANAASPSLPDLVRVAIEAASDASEQVAVRLSPAPATTPAPSLIDLLATLAVTPSASLPSSLLPLEESLRSFAARSSNRADAHAAASGSAASAAATAASPSPSSTNTAASALLPGASFALEQLERQNAWPFAVSLSAMRLGEEAEGHSSFDNLDLLHNRAPQSNTRKSAQRKASARHNSDDDSDGDSPSSAAPRTRVVCGDHELELVRTVGLLCSWSPPRDGSMLAEPVLVSQQPFLSLHAELRITRIDPDEAREKAMDALLGL